MAPRLTVLAMMLLLAACGSTPENRNIRLDLRGDVPKVAAPLHGTLQVLPFGARGVLGERRLAYLDATAPDERKQSASVTWEEYPTQAAMIVAVETLRAAGVADAVFAPDRPGLADYTLSARLDRFELADNAAVVDLNVTVLSGEERKAFLMGHYCATVAVSTPGTAAVEAAFNEAYRQTMVKLADDLVHRGGLMRASC